MIPEGTDTMDGRRRKPPAECNGKTRKFSIAGFEGYLIIDRYEDGAPCRVDLKVAKEGSFVSGMLHSIAGAMSVALQYGVPPSALHRELGDHLFEPCGVTTDEHVPMVSSIVDYVVRHLELLTPTQAPVLAEASPLPELALPMPAIAPPVSHTHVAIGDYIVPVALAGVVQRSISAWPESTPELVEVVRDGRAGGAGRPHHQAPEQCPAPYYRHGDRRAYCTCTPPETT